MKTTTLFMAMAVSAAMSAYADDNCTIRMNIVPIDGGEEVGASVASRLEAKLMPVLSEADIAIDHSYTKLFVAGRFDNTYSEVLGGTTPRILVKTTLTLYFGNLQEQHVYSSRSFDLKGSGVSMEAAYTKCLGALSQRQAEVRNFLAEGRDKAISYFDNNYTTYLATARQAMLARNYAEALYYATSIPECSKGWPQASALTAEIYTDYTNYEGLRLLAQARGAWAASPDAEGARKAYAYLSQIDPAASCASQADALGREIAAKTKSDWKFENETKYHDALSIEKQRIEAARAIGEAWAKNQPQNDTKVYWIVR